MKKILIIVLAVFLLASMLTACIDWTNYGYWSKFCKDNDDFSYYFKNHGQCVSWHAQDDAAKAAQLCKDLDEVELLTGEVFENHGQCQVWVKDNLPPLEGPY